jgi:hypothetical protein
MGLLNRAIKIRRLKMKLFNIDNPKEINLDKKFPISAIIKGQKIIILPWNKKEIINTGGYVPHIKLQNYIFKYCHKCKKWLLLRMFIKNKYSKDGYKDACSSCDNERRRKRYRETKAVT